LALACLGWSSLALVRPSGFVLALAGLAATLAITARPALRTAVRRTAFGVLVASLWPLAAWWRGVPLLGAEILESFASSWAVDDRTLVAVLVGPLWIVTGAGLGPAFLRLARPRDVTAQEPRRDLAALCCFGALVVVLAVSVVALYDGSTLLFARTWAPGLLVQAAPFAAVLAARSLVRMERPD
ncbi:MAG TPA: hypothetical protein VM509_13930, partial [Planctomycetota bacterium]|nr:hypothetical protein [Planctomycetota bacterium]